MARSPLSRGAGLRALSHHQGGETPPLRQKSFLIKNRKGFYVLCGLCHNVILSVSEESRLLNYRRDSSVAEFTLSEANVLPQNDKRVILRDYDTVSI